MVYKETEDSKYLIVRSRIYISLDATVQEAIWLRNLACEIDPEIVSKPTIIYCDNKSDIEFGKSESYSIQLKHIDISYRFILHHINEGTIDLQYMNTKEMLADFLTKPLFGEKHQFGTKGIGLQNPPSEFTANE